MSEDLSRFIIYVVIALIWFIIATARRWRRTRLRSIKPGIVLSYRSAVSGKEEALLVNRVKTTENGEKVVTDPTGRRVKMVVGGFEVMAHWVIKPRKIKPGDVLIRGNNVATVNTTEKVGRAVKIKFTREEQLDELLANRVKVYRCLKEGKSFR